MQITTTDVIRFAIVAFTLVLTLWLLENSPFGFLIRNILPITTAAIIVTVWKLCDVIAWLLGFISNPTKIICKEDLEQFFCGVACKIEKAIFGLEYSISSALAWLLGWFQFTLWEEWQRFQNKETPEEVQMRVALLVSTRSGLSHEAVLRAFGTSISFSILLHSNYPKIEWNSTETTILHRPSKEAAFARSFSVCLIPYSI